MPDAIMSVSIATEKAVAQREAQAMVDDDLGVRRFAARVLSSRGYAVLTASSPTEAIEIAEQHEGTIDLLLTDIVLPGGTGRALATTLRESSPGLKVLFMSGYTTEAIVDYGMLDPSLAFIGKTVYLTASRREGPRGD